MTTGSTPSIRNRVRSTKPAKNPAVEAKAGDSEKTPASESNHAMLLSPEAQNAAGILAWSRHMGEPRIDALLQEVIDKTKVVTDGDMRLVEAMLFGQAATLQNLFSNLLQRAAGQEGLPQFTAMLSLGLKAQAQCRCTLEALAEIKNPRPVAFVKQANIAHGPQQVNNSDRSAASASRTESVTTSQNELLEAHHEQRLDTRAQGTAGGAHRALETVGAIDRPEDQGR